MKHREFGGRITTKNPCQATQSIELNVSGMSLLARKIIKDGSALALRVVLREYLLANLPNAFISLTVFQPALQLPLHCVFPQTHSTILA